MSLKGLYLGNGTQLTISEKFTVQESTMSGTRIVLEETEAEIQKLVIGARSVAAGAGKLSLTGALELDDETDIADGTHGLDLDGEIELEITVETYDLAVLRPTLWDAAKLTLGGKEISFSNPPVSFVGMGSEIDLPSCRDGCDLPLM